MILMLRCTSGVGRSILRLGQNGRRHFPRSGCACNARSLFASPPHPASNTTKALMGEKERHYTRSENGSEIIFNPGSRCFSSASADESTGKSDAADENKKNQENSQGRSETMEFQAETRQLLDIVTHSLYTDKEVFLRELISNASDALEKLRHVQATNAKKTIQADLPLEIRVETNEVDGTLTITDTGIGLTKSEMVKNLGTIARSGSKAFVQEVAGKDRKEDDSGNPSAIIGKFGVGFYSAFMVGNTVEVRSKSAIETETEEPSLVWSSSGLGTFDVSELSPDVRQDRGASVLIHLKENDAEFCDEKRIETILKKYSNFVNFPIFLNGERVNTMEAVWSLDPNSVSEDTHSAFYKFIANAYDEPLSHVHFRADAPLEVRALFYIPSFHSEKHGMGRMDPGVSLYSKKVLIEAKSPDILPDWMRFIRGVVDSEDLPLSISREKAQDTALIKKLRKVLTRKFISHLTTMARKEPTKYKTEFFGEFGFFLKEGICQDYEFQELLSKLLYFETSKTMPGEMISLDEYVSRCAPEQKEIYYLCAPSRELAIESPYMEAFERAGREVLFVYSAIDDFVMTNLGKFENRELVTAEKGDLDLGGDEDAKDQENEDSTTAGLSVEQASEFCAWFEKTLDDKVDKVKVTSRLGASPAVVTDNESGALRRMMRMVNNQDTSQPPIPKQTVEVNVKHPVIVRLHAIREEEPTLAKTCAEQIFDNCLVAAGLLDDSRSMLPRLNDLLLCVVNGVVIGPAIGEEEAKLNEEVPSAVAPKGKPPSEVTEKVDPPSEVAEKVEPPSRVAEKVESPPVVADGDESQSEGTLKVEQPSDEGSIESELKGTNKPTLKDVYSSARKGE